MEVPAVDQRDLDWGLEEPVHRLEPAEATTNDDQMRRRQLDPTNSSPFHEMRYDDAVIPCPAAISSEA